MVKKSSRRLSEQERDERRRADRERLQRAAAELLSSEGWAQWVRVRSMFRSHSAGNCMLLAAQCHERGIVPMRIAGFRTWLKLGRCVRKGEAALRILAPVTVKQREDRDEESAERRVFFKTAFVFDVVDAAVPANAQLRTLIHECAHALGIDYERYSRPQAEVIVDTAIFCPRRPRVVLEPGRSVRNTWHRRHRVVVRVDRRLGQNSLAANSSNRCFHPGTGSQPQLRPGISCSSHA
jgi:N-terminal domain of anti-restriction factor ArdC